MRKLMVDWYTDHFELLKKTKYETTFLNWNDHATRKHNFVMNFHMSQLIFAQSKWLIEIYPKENAVNISTIS